MLLLLQACLHMDQKALDEFHDDAGYLLKQVEYQNCRSESPCVIWDLGAFEDGPRAVAMGRSTPTIAYGVSHGRLSRFGLEHDFDGVVAIVQEDNPLYRVLVELGCTSRGVCTIINDGHGTHITKNGAGTASIIVDEK